MEETFSTNLESATEEEEKAKKTHAAFIKTKKEAWDEMDASYQKKQGSLGSNDGDLATKKTSLETAKTQLDDDTSFLEKLEDMCSQKAKEHFIGGLPRGVFVTSLSFVAETTGELPRG